MSEIYSKAWFEAVASVNPGIAALAEIALSKNTSKKGCCICADTPSSVCQQVDSKLPLLRLCSDCVEIRRNMYGEIYVEVSSSC